jgi:hypothetical protein
VGVVDLEPESGLRPPGWLSSSALALAFTFDIFMVVAAVGLGWLDVLSMAA